MRGLAAVCTTLLVLSGCGGGGGGASTRAVTVEGGSALRVAGREYSFDPGSVVVKRSGELTIRFQNAGSLAHDIRLRHDGREIGGTPSIPAGKRATAHVHLAAGSYEFLCTVGDHAKLGMRGRLRVE